MQSVAHVYGAVGCIRIKVTLRLAPPVWHELEAATAEAAAANADAAAAYEAAREVALVQMPLFPMAVLHWMLRQHHLQAPAQ